MLSSVWSCTTFANRGKSPSLAVAWGFNVPCLPTLELEEGLEPPTRCLQSSRSTRLSYTSVCVSKCVLTCRLWFNATHRKATIAHIWPCRSLSGIRHSDIIRALPGIWWRFRTTLIYTERIKSRMRTLTSRTGTSAPSKSDLLELPNGIEPPSAEYESAVLPLNYGSMCRTFPAVSH